jgi:Bacterial EndoU nuclease
VNRLMRNLTIWVLAFAFASTSQAGLLGNLLPRPSTVIVGGAAAAAIYAQKHCKTVKDRETGQSTLICKTPNIAKSDSATQDEKPSLIDDKGKKHILDGDGPNGGGHRSGTGKPGKSEFPADWSDEKIEGEISDIATDPAVEWIGPNRNGYIVGTGVREGVEIQVVKDQKSGRIITGYPANLSRNP